MSRSEHPRHYGRSSSPLLFLWSCETLGEDVPKIEPGSANNKTTPVVPAVTKSPKPDEAVVREKFGQTPNSSNEWEEVTTKKSQKEFDRIDHKYMVSIVQATEFEPDFCTWTTLQYRFPNCCGTVEREAVDCFYAASCGLSGLTAIALTLGICVGSSPSPTEGQGVQTGNTLT